MMNTKRHNGHFLKVKKTGTTSKKFLNSRSKEFLSISFFYIYNASVTITSVFCKEGPKPNRFVRKV
jgi:hypothetical protein